MIVLSGFEPKLQKWENRSKMAKIWEKCKTPPRPVVVPPHQKSGRKNGLEICPVSKTAIFGLKMPKKCNLAVLMAPSSKVMTI